MALVVDTDVVSFIFKKDTRAALYVPHLSGQMLTISFQTLAELELWTLAAGWGAQRKQQLARHLRRYIVEDSSPALCRRWAEVLDDARRVSDCNGGCLERGDREAFGRAARHTQSLALH